MNTKINEIAAAISLSKQGKIQEAILSLEDTLKTNLTIEEKSRAVLALSNCYNQMNKPQTALNLAMSILNCCENDELRSILHYNLSVLMQKLNRHSESEFYKSKVLENQKASEFLKQKIEEIKPNRFNGHIGSFKDSGILIDCKFNNNLSKVNDFQPVFRPQSINKHVKIKNTPDQSFSCSKLNQSASLPAIPSTQTANLCKKILESGKITYKFKPKVIKRSKNTFSIPEPQSTTTKKSSIDPIQARDIQVIPYKAVDLVTASPLIPSSLEISKVDNLSIMPDRFTRSAVPDINSLKKSSESNSISENQDIKGSDAPSVRSSSRMLFKKKSEPLDMTTVTPKSKAHAPAQGKKKTHVRIKKINEKLCKIKFLRTENNLKLFITDPKGILKILSVPSDLSSLSYNSILNYLDFDGASPVLLKSPWELLETRVKTIQGTDIVIEFHYNSDLNRLKVQVPSDTKEYNLPAGNMIEIIKNKVDDVYDCIMMIDKAVVIQDTRYGCALEGFKEIDDRIYLIRIIIEQSLGLLESHSAYIGGNNLRIEFINTGHEVFTLVYTLEEICEIFSITLTQIYLILPEILKKLTIKSHRYPILSKKITDTLKLILLHTSYKKISIKYNINIYNIPQKNNLLLITAQPQQINSTKYFIVTENLNYADSKDMFDYILNKITLVKDKLYIVIKNPNTVNKSAIVIQKCVRGYLYRERYKLLKNSKKSLVYRTGMKFLKKTVIVTVKKTADAIVLDIHGDYKLNIVIPSNISHRLKNYKVINSCLVLKDSQLVLDVNLLTLYLKESEFLVPAELRSYTKVFEKWKLINNEYCKVSILENIGKYALLVDNLYKIMTKDEIVDIYHEVSLECIYDEITLKNNLVYLDPSTREEPVLIISKNFLDKNSFISATLRDQVYGQFNRQKFLFFDIVIEDNHNRIVLDLDTAIQKTGIPGDYLVPICNYIISKGIKVTSDSVIFSLDFGVFDFTNRIISIQKLYRGYSVRKIVGKIRVKGNNFLAAVQRKVVSGIHVMLFAYIQHGKIRIEALDKDYRLVLYLDQNFIKGFKDIRKKVIEGAVFDNLYIDNSNGMKRLCINTNLQLKNSKLNRESSIKTNLELIDTRIVKLGHEEYETFLYRLASGMLLVAKSPEKEFRTELKIDIPKYLEKSEIENITDKIFSQITIEKNELKINLL